MSIELWGTVLDMCEFLLRQNIVIFTSLLSSMSVRALAIEKPHLL